IVNNILDVLFVERVARNDQLHLIESGSLAELYERRLRDVAVDDVLHPRLRLPDVVNAAADAKRSLRSVRRADDDVLADLDSRDLKRVALDEDLAGRRRPRALLGIEFADANVCEVFDREQ